MKLILLGAPGAGKGTQAERISAKYDIPVIGTGNLIREKMKAGTPAGQKAKEYMETGKLVPDEIVIEILLERLQRPDCKNGYILDGFPRNVPQAEALDRMGIVIQKVIELEVADETIIGRIVGRRVCGNCGSSYHMEYKLPKQEGICDSCGSGLVMRADDKPETVQERLSVYHQQTEPLKDYYKAAHKLVVVEGQNSVDDTTRLTFTALEAQPV